MSKPTKLSQLNKRKLGDPIKLGREVGPEGPALRELDWHAYTADLLQERDEHLAAERERFEAAGMRDDYLTLTSLRDKLQTLQRDHRFEVSVMAREGLRAEASLRGEIEHLKGALRDLRRQVESREVLIKDLLRQVGEAGPEAAKMEPEGEGVRFTSSNVADVISDAISNWSVHPPLKARGDPLEHRWKDAILRGDP